MSETHTSQNRENEDKKGRGWHGDPEGHAKAGQVGGNKVARDRAYMAEIGRRGGTKVAQNRAYMAEIGRKGGLRVKEEEEQG
jgi:general stress protein YciG